MFELKKMREKSHFSYFEYEEIFFLICIQQILEVQHKVLKTF